MKRILTIIFFTLFLISVLGFNHYVNVQSIKDKGKALSLQETYANYFYNVHREAFHNMIRLNKAISILLGYSKLEEIENSQNAWKKAHNAYGLIAPILNSDFYSDNSKLEPIVARINPWPINPDSLDYAPDSIVYNKGFLLTKDHLMNTHKNQAATDPILGFHAIEFLLWGKDENPDGTGTRNLWDYIEDDNVSKTRRREYLRSTMEILNEDLDTLAYAWKPGTKNNLRDPFIAQSEEEALSVLLSILNQASNRLIEEQLSPLFTKQNEAFEQSQFSDYTRDDLAAYVEGMRKLYLADFRHLHGRNIHEHFQDNDNTLADKILVQLDTVAEAIADIPQPVDQKVLRSEAHSAARKTIESAMSELHKLNDLIIRAARSCGIEM